MFGLIIYEDISNFLYSLILPAAEAIKYRKEIKFFIKYNTMKFNKK